jgi:hypothetical protein
MKRHSTSAALRTHKMTHFGPHSRFGERRYLVVLLFLLGPDAKVLGPLGDFGISDEHLASSMSVLSLDFSGQYNSVVRGIHQARLCDRRATGQDRRAIAMLEWWSSPKSIKYIAKLCLCLSQDRNLHRPLFVRQLLSFKRKSWPGTLD